MNILQKLTTRNLYENKRRTLVTILGVMLSSALILAVVGMVTSFQKMMINFTIAERGDYHEMFQDVPVEALQYIENNQHVASYFYAEPLKASDVSEDTWDTYATYQHSPYKAEYFQPLATLPSDAQAAYDIYVRYDAPKSYQEIRESILTALESATGEAINYRTNSDLLRYESQVMGDAALATLYSLAAIIICIIVITSIFVIRNSFSISATERARQFGMLASVGATPRQIRHSVIFEGFIIALIGIPLGILLGIVAVAILVVVVNVLLEGMIEAAVEFSLPLWIFPVTILLSLLTVFFSSLMPAIRAARMSPIEAIRGNQDIKIKAKKLRTSKLVQNLFGIGGVIADKNLKRSRKKYRTTVISIVLSVATFIGLYSFIGYGKNMISLEFGDSKIDFVMSGAEDTEFYQDLVSRFDLKNSVYYLGHSSSSEIPVYAMEASAFRNFAKQFGVNDQDMRQAVLLNDRSFNLREDGSYVVERLTDLQPGDTYKANIIPETPTKCVSNSSIEDESGISWVVDVDDACVKAEGAEPYNVDLQVTKIIDQYPFGFESYHSPMILVSTASDRLADLGFAHDFTSEFFASEVDDVDAITTYLDEYFEAHPTDQPYYYQNVKESISQMRRIYLLISIFLYGFIIVVTLIGVTNIFNTITTNIALRAKEFAMLKSIGMTSREFNRMVRLESLMYSFKALVIGIPLGLLISYGFYQSIANSVDFGWIIPWAALLISIIAVGILVGIIMRYSVRQVEKQNIIETIRSENI